MICSTEDMWNHPPEALNGAVTQPRSDNTETGKSDFRVLVSVLPLSYLKNSVGFVLQKAHPMVAQI